jgi:hypothetical protein
VLQFRFQIQIHLLSFRVHGDSRKLVTDRSILPGSAAPPQMDNTWRPDLEQQIISSSTRKFVDGIVIRPGMVFGGSSTTFSTWFAPLIDAKKNGSVAQVPGKRDALISTVYKDDLGVAYRLIVEKVSIIFSKFISISYCN